MPSRRRRTSSAIRCISIFWRTGQRARPDTIFRSAKRSTACARRLNSPPPAGRSHSSRPAIRAFTLAFELLETGGRADWGRVAIQVCPGISALQAAAARSGAPLGHDFCTISLSDLLTPWEAIERRLRAAADGDFVVAFYNPVSRRRTWQLGKAREILLTGRPETTPVVLARNLGRDGEQVRVVTLGTLDPADVDMLTVVLVGSSESRTVARGDGRHWVYTPRGYAGKQAATQNDDMKGTG
jgi:cobalt-precorrin 5A hydrolase / precorrin-3B C17-methyltransferase